MVAPRDGFGKALAKFFRWIDQPLLNGTIPSVAGLSVSEEGVGPVRRTVLTFTDVAFALTDEAGVVAYSGKKVYDFPEAAIGILGANANLVVSKSSAGVDADFNGDFGVGTVTASNNATLSSTEQNIIPTTATPQAMAGVTTAKGVSTSTEAFKVLDGTGTPVDLFLNFLVDDGDQDVTSTPCNLIVNGTLEVLWLNLGDK
jgi:hypothetical protein